MITSRQLSSFFLLVTLSTFFSCENDEDLIKTEIIKVRLNHYFQPSTSFELSSNRNYFIQEGNNIGSDEWKQISFPIGGFDFELGYTYDLIVEKKTDKRPIMDSSGISYTFKKEVSKNKVPANTIFEIWLAHKDFVSYLTLDNESDFKIQNEINIECEMLCAQLSEKVAAMDDIVGVFKHVNNTTIRLVEIKP